MCLKNVFKHLGFPCKDQGEGTTATIIAADEMQAHGLLSSAELFGMNFEWMCRVCKSGDCLLKLGPGSDRGEMGMGWCAGVQEQFPDGSINETSSMQTCGILIGSFVSILAYSTSRSSVIPSLQLSQHEWYLESRQQLVMQQGHSVFYGPVLADRHHASSITFGTDKSCCLVFWSNG